MNFVRYIKSESARKKITKKQMREINSLYSDLYKKMKKEADIVSKKKTFSAGWEKLYLDNFVKELKEEMQNINQETSKIVKNGTKEMAEYVVKENNEFLSKIGLYINGAFSYVPTKVVAQIINGNVYNGKWSLSKSIWGANKKDIKNIERIVAEGIASNKPTKNIANNLVQYSKSGKAKYNAMRLARTMTNHAYQKAFQMTTEKNPFIEAYKWNNGHHSNVCPICQDLATKNQFGLGAGIFPKDEIPLDHPNGYCFITAITMSNKQIDDYLVDWVNDTGNKSMNKKLDAFSKDMGFLPTTVKNNYKKV